MKQIQNSKISSITKKLGGYLILLELTILILYGTVIEYSEGVYPSRPGGVELLSKYPLFQDIHVMMFVGFGFLMVFLHQHSWSSVGFNLLVAVVSIQACILYEGFWRNVFNGKWEKFQINILWLILGDFGAAAVLISFGAILGKLNAFQLVVMATIELFFYTLNEAIGYIFLKAADIGGSMIIHCFGGFFGLTVSFLISPPNVGNNPRATSNYNSNLISMIGTIFLWMYWPSFNSALSSGNAAHRAVMNTVLSLTASCLATFALSILFNNGKFNMEDVLNATLAGGVAQGATADIISNPVYSLLLGFIAGSFSTFGFNRLGKFLYKNLGLHDTCGVNNLHAIPGFLGGFISIIVAAGSTNIEWGKEIGSLYPEMGLGRSASAQAGYQCACLIITVILALGSGTFTGFILRTKFFEGPLANETFVDARWWTETQQVIDQDAEILIINSDRKISSNGNAKSVNLNAKDVNSNADTILSAKVVNLIAKDVDKNTKYGNENVKKNSKYAIQDENDNEEKEKPLFFKVTMEEHINKVN